jgi:hypothetical protein
MKRDFCLPGAAFGLITRWPRDPREQVVNVVSRRDLVLAAGALALSRADRKAALAGEAAPKLSLMNDVAISAATVPKNYIDAPMLSRLVKEGRLPRVADRLRLC